MYDFIYRQELLKESYVLMEIRKLLRSYGIRNFNHPYQNQIMVKKKKEMAKEKHLLFFIYLYSAVFSLHHYI